MNESTRSEEIRIIHHKHRFYYEMLGGGFVLICSIILGMTRFGGNSQNDYLMNLFTEGMGIVATVFLINRWYAKREQESLRKRLIREAGSRSHDIAISAVEWMDREQWLRGEDGLLQGENLQDARLWDARMDGANLQRTILDRAVLCKVTLKCANLRDAHLRFAELHNAKLNNAGLQNSKCHGVMMPGAMLEDACLKCADLSYACLEGASLQGAYFKGANLHEAKLKDAFLWDADFFDADLTLSELREAKYHKKANWEKTKLKYVNLQCVDFSEANMKEADLECANLEGAILFGTNLQGANLMGALLKGARFTLWDTSRCASVVVDGMIPNIEDLPDGKIVRKINLKGATLPDGTVFTEEMDYSYLSRFIYENDKLFERTLAALTAYRDRP